MTYRVGRVSALLHAIVSVPRRGGSREFYKAAVTRQQQCQAIRVHAVAEAAELGAVVLLMQRQGAVTRAGAVYPISGRKSNGFHNG